MDRERNVWRRYYRCRTFNKTERDCTLKGINADYLEITVIEIIKKICNDTEYLRNIACQAAEQALNNTMSTLEDKNRLQEKLEAIEKEQHELVIALGRKTIPIHIIESRIAELEEERKIIVSQIEEINKEIQIQEHNKIDMEFIIEQLSNFNTLFDSLTFTEKRNLLQLLIKEIVCHPNEIEIYLYYTPFKLMIDEQEEENNFGHLMVTGSISHQMPKYLTIQTQVLAPKIQRRNPAKPNRKTSNKNKSKKEKTKKILDYEPLRLTY